MRVTRCEAVQGKYSPRVHQMDFPPEGRVSQRGTVLVISVASYLEMGLDEFSDIMS